MYKTSVYTLANGNIEKLAHRKQQKSQKVILPASHWLCVRYLLHKPSYSQFCPKFRCHGNQWGSGVKLNDTTRLAIHKNHIPEPKITTLSYTQPQLW